LAAAHLSSSQNSITESIILSARLEGKMLLLYFIIQDSMSRNKRAAAAAAVVS